MPKIDGVDFRLPDDEPERQRNRERIAEESGLPLITFQSDDLAPDIEPDDLARMRVMAMTDRSQWDERDRQVSDLTHRFRSWLYTYTDIVSEERLGQSESDVT